MLDNCDLGVDSLHPAVRAILLPVYPFIDAMAVEPMLAWQIGVTAVIQAYHTDRIFQLLADDRENLSA